MASSAWKVSVVLVIVYVHLGQVYTNFYTREFCFSVWVGIQNFGGGFNWVFWQRNGALFFLYPGKITTITTKQTARTSQVFLHSNQCSWDPQAPAELASLSLMSSLVPGHMFPFSWYFDCYLFQVWQISGQLWITDTSWTCIQSVMREIWYLKIVLSIPCFLFSSVILYVYQSKVCRLTLWTVVFHFPSTCSLSTGFSACFRSEEWQHLLVPHDKQPFSLFYTYVWSLFCSPLPLWKLFSLICI